MALTVAEELRDAEREVVELRAELDQYHESAKYEKLDHEYEGRHNAYAIAIGLLQDVRRNLLTLDEYERALEDAE